MKQGSVVLAAAFALSGCVSYASGSGGGFDPLLPAAAAALDPVAADDEGPGPVDVGHVVLLYLPNRVLDAFDMARAGVNLGPGIGGHAKATDPVQVLWMSRASVGVGLQGLRHLPAYAAVENGVALGPAGADANVGVGWYQSPTDLRLEAHPFVVGAHVAVDPVEIADFILGFFTVDIREDDY